MLHQVSRNLWEEKDCLGKPFCFVTGNAKRSFRLPSEKGCISVARAKRGHILGCCELLYACLKALELTRFLRHLRMPWGFCLDLIDSRVHSWRLHFILSFSKIGCQATGSLSGACTYL